MMVILVRAWRHARRIDIICHVEVAASPKSTSSYLFGLWPQKCVCCLLSFLRYLSFFLIAHPHTHPFNQTHTAVHTQPFNQTHTLIQSNTHALLPKHMHMRVHLCLYLHGLTAFSLSSHLLKAYTLRQTHEHTRDLPNCLFQSTSLSHILSMSLCLSLSLNNRLADQTFKMISCRIWNPKEFKLVFRRSL